MKEALTAHPDTLKLQRMQVVLLQREARIRELEAILAVGAARCPMCGTQVVMDHA